MLNDKWLNMILDLDVMTFKILSLEFFSSHELSSLYT